MWFVLQEHELLLLPVQGSQTQWFRNLQKNRSIRISARGEQGEFQARTLSEGKQISAIVEKFREKYGAADIKKYYSVFDGAVVVGIS